MAERALSYAYRRGDPWIGTGHLLLATLDARDRTVDRIVGSGAMGSGPVHDRLARTLMRALPGGEHPTGEVDGGGVISFDLLIRMLANWFREQLPAGWVMHASGRSGGFRLRVPNSRSEEDYAIDMSWIVTSDQSGRDRLLEVTRTALAELQMAVVEATSTSWPSAESDVGLPEPHAAIAGRHRQPHPSAVVRPVERTRSSSSHRGCCQHGPVRIKPELRRGIPHHDRRRPSSALPGEHRKVGRIETAVTLRRHGECERRRLRLA